MPLAPGTRLGPYEVTAQIGVGGMGEVYQATDTKLKRQVAIKVLPESVAADKDRLARFQREAEVLASLNHPHIAAIYGLEDADGGKALVMELVEGPTLADRIAQAAIPVDEAIAIARQIAEALEAAHEQGIIHRDLKPANVKVREDGTVKVLDFGLAKALEPVSASSPDISHSPTLTSPALSRVGMILGTAAYMSPEQARGKAVDKRADIWAFGVVLFEMMAGKNAFPGEDVQEVLAGVINKEPDWEAIPSGLDPRIQKLLGRCLRKDRKHRLHDIGDVRVEIQEILAEPRAAAEATRARTPVIAWTLAGLLGVALLAALGVMWRSTGAPQPSTRLSVALGAGGLELVNSRPLDGARAVLSPRGQMLAFVGRTGNGRAQLFIRSLDSLEATPLGGTDDASAPFFSPDGQWLAFFAGGALRKVSVGGGAVLTIAPVQNPRGGTWGPDDTIVYAPGSATGLYRVSASGGAPVELTRLAEGEESHRWPWFLPNGRVVLFSVAETGRSFDDGAIEAFAFNTGERRVVQRGGTYPRYSSSGYLLYARGATLFALPFDADRSEATGEAGPVIEGLEVDTGVPLFAVSDGGSLVYVPEIGAAVEGKLVWVDHEGKASPVTDTLGDWETPRLSPDGRRLAVRKMEAAGSQNVWLFELARGSLQRLTFDDGLRPVWSADGQRVFFASQPANPQKPESAQSVNIFWTSADGGGPAERLTSGPFRVPEAITADGKTLVYRQGGDGASPGLGVGMMSLDEDKEPEMLLDTDFDEHTPKLSPDDRWLAHVSNESGRDEIYVTRFPRGGKWQISTEGGREPLWSRDGRELFYRSGQKMMAVAVSDGPNLAAGKPTLLFEGPYALKDGSGATNYDVAEDGRFVMILPEARSSGPTHVTLVLNWFEELKRLVPTN